MKQIILTIFLLIAFCLAADAQTIRVNPTGVNVNSQNPTTVFLTFGQIPPGYIPAEAVWCGELIPAVPPALGLQCNPATIYGSLPSRFNRSQASGNLGFTDIMAIPPSVVRRAYQAALGGAGAGFFYVRRFVSTSGGPDQFVSVTCRMAGGGARVPFALTDVQIIHQTREPILFLKTGETFPEIVAEIRYNGTGRLKGRWEVVQPGEEPPKNTDLLTEATLPIEQRGTQRRYTQISRFNHFLPPTGKFTLKLENPERLPTFTEGQHILLLRIEATDDKESDSNLAAVGVGSGVVHSGAVASFPMPVLKFFVTGAAQSLGLSGSTSLLPKQLITVSKIQPLIFVWKTQPEAVAYRLEVLDEKGNAVLSAILLSPISSYRAPSWFVERFDTRKISWRVAALDENGNAIEKNDQ